MYERIDPAKKTGPLGIYIHVPYCIRKCRYCDFVSFEKAPEDAYFRRIAQDIEKGAKAASGLLGNSGSKPSADTVFFGGGTPSLASKEQLGTVLDALRKAFELSPDAEMTIEVNPETVTAGKASELKALGFSRVSMGVQSLDDKVLKAMGRIHGADRARKAYAALRDAGFDAVRVPVTWAQHMDPAGRVDPAWLERVAEVAGWVLDEGMVCTKIIMEKKNVMYYVECDEILFDISTLSDASDLLKAILVEEFNNTEDPDIAMFRNMCKKAGYGIGYCFVGNKSQKKVKAALSAKELK